MIYSKIETNDEGTPIKCPRCEAEQLNDNFTYCPWCSLILHNMCLGTDENKYEVLNFDGDTREKSLEEQIKDGCGPLLNGGFRYCPKCGGESSYFRQGILNNWESELEEKNLKTPYLFRKQKLYLY
ncbi:hypothetical protein [Enterococcus avium]|uniref:hypothetical protein n=1 Tax=Enterococcus avium TaxID=33945 RepID=UPI003799E291